MHDNYELDLLLQLVQERKFRALREILNEMNEVDIAEFLDELDVEREILVFRLLPKDLAAEVFSYLEEDQEKLKLLQRSQPRFTEGQRRELREVHPWVHTGGLPTAIDVTVSLQDLPSHIALRDYTWG